MVAPERDDEWTCMGCFLIVSARQFGPTHQSGLSVRCFRLPLPGPALMMPNDPTRSARTIVDRILDVGVFAPLGMLLERDRLLGELAAAGRKQVEFSRSLGRVALRTISSRGAPSRGARSATDRVAPAPAEDRAPAEPTSTTTPSWASHYSSMSAREILAAVESGSPDDLRCGSRHGTGRQETGHRVALCRATAELSDDRVRRSRGRRPQSTLHSQRRSATMARAEVVDERGGRWLLEHDLPRVDVTLRHGEAVDADDRCVVVGQVDGVVVGYAYAYLSRAASNLLCMIEELFVHPQARGVGVGAALSAHVRSWAQASNCVAIESHVLPGNRAAKNFFERVGMVRRAR